MGWRASGPIGASTSRLKAMLKAVFFDAAGTLFETRAPVAEIYAGLAREFGLEAKPRSIGAAFRRAFGSAPGLAFGAGRQPQELRKLEREWWRQRVAETFARIGKFADFDAYFDRLFATFADPLTWKAYPEAIPALRRLKDQGLIIGLISNFDHRVYGVLEGLGLGATLDSTTISSEAGYAKPAPEIFELALSKHGLACSECLHVGDSIPLDIEGAKAAGINPILMRAAANTHTPAGTLAVKSLEEIPDLVEKLRLTS
jgi:putative hydrolase of the HAD superfamily